MDDLQDMHEVMDEEAEYDARWSDWAEAQRAEKEKG